ncbi:MULTISPECIES: bifunctional DNA primase/polymerase [unclassified Streptomyces]|uniref:bifunctional DNA primase/polymerase n=1 Tax=Streptomyces sp. SID8367 TaxID=2690349 RepID=UPI0021AD4BB4|nr:bifunctional DNA primase/polymerase [Streptomyces sp. PsTaAH-137]
MTHPRPTRHPSSSLVICPAQCPYQECGTTAPQDSATAEPRWGEDVQTMTRRGIEWLSASADDPVTCRAHWADDPRQPTMLHTGRFFDVVSVGQRLGLETFDQMCRQGLPCGPAMVDRAAQRVGFFLGSNSRDGFAHLVNRESTKPLAYRYLGANAVVVVPGPMPLTGDRYEWLRAPIRRLEANPLRPIALATLLAASAELLARVDHYGERYRSPADALATHPEEPSTGA